MPAGVVDGSRIQGEKRASIVVALANGQSSISIARDAGCSRDVVRAIQRAEFATVSQIKDRITSQHEQAATRALDLINAKLDAAEPKTFSLSELNIVAGTSSDKILALRGDSVSTVRHIHSLDLDEGDLLAFALQRSKTAQAHVVEPKALT